MKIRLIVPIVTEGLRLDEHVRAMGGADAELTAVLLDRGPASIEGEMDEAFALPGIVEQAIAAERDGCDAIVIDCMGDPGLAAAREAVEIPVLGPAQTAMHVASMLGHRFGVITVLQNLHALLWKLARIYGVAGNMAPVRSVGIPVLDLDKDPAALRDAFIREAVAAVRHDEVDVLVFGCTGMYGMVQQVETGLRAHGIAGVPILDPTPLAVQMAVMLCRSGLGHSKQAFPLPRIKEIRGYAGPSGNVVP